MPADCRCAARGQGETLERQPWKKTMTESGDDTRANQPDRQWYTTPSPETWPRYPGRSDLPSRVAGSPVSRYPGQSPGPAVPRFRNAAAVPGGPNDIEDCARYSGRSAPTLKISR